jgi:hypothetical protein
MAAFKGKQVAYPYARIALTGTPRGLPIFSAR